MPTERCSWSGRRNGSLASEAFEASAMLGESFGSPVPEIRQGEAIRCEYRDTDGEQKHRKPLMPSGVPRDSVDEDQEYPDR